MGLTNGADEYLDGALAPSNPMLAPPLGITVLVILIPTKQPLVNTYTKGPSIFLVIKAPEIHKVNL